MVVNIKDFLVVEVRDGKRNGKGYLYNQNRFQTAELLFIDYCLEGECYFYNYDGVLEYYGYLHNSILTGLGHQCDKMENEIDLDVFKNGQKVSILIKKENMDGYWSEMRNEVLLLISQYSSEWKKQDYYILYKDAKLCCCRNGE